MNRNLLKASAFLAIPLVVLSTSLTSLANSPAGMKAQPAAKHEFERSHPGPSFLEQLRLTPEQKDKIRALQTQGHESSRALHQQLKAKRQALMEYLQSVDADEARAQSLQAEVNDMQAQMSAQRLKSWFQMRAILTPEQRLRLQQLKPQRPMRPRNTGIVPPPPPPPPVGAGVPDRD
jgi:Spy/CpxP family protein refolding chaperone